MNAYLRRLDRDEAVELAREVERGYAEEMEQNGAMPREAAKRKAASDLAALMEDGTAAVFAVEVDGDRVGHLWVGERDLNSGRALWIYDVFVDEAFRGRGFGRDAMRLAEEEARRRGIESIGLNVFGANGVARRLYGSLGYNEVAVSMRKDLG